MAGCFDFRMRASSFDMHQLAQRHKFAKFGKLFRSKSDTNVKTGSPSGSPIVSPKGSPGGSPSQQPRRRFMRVVRDAEQEGEEYENPHVIRKYTQGYVEEKYTPMQKSVSLDESARGGSTGSLPYTPQEDSILKKGLSLDITNNVSPANSVSGGEHSPPACNKHASFKEEVVIIEYDKKGKIQKCACLTHKEKLHDDSDSDFLEESSEECDLLSDKENTMPVSIAAACATNDVKSLKDSSLKDIVNSEKAVDRDSDNSDAEQQPIKRSKRLTKQDEQEEEDEEEVDIDSTNSRLHLLTKHDEDLLSAKKHLAAEKTSSGLDDDSIASSITKVHIHPFLNIDEDQVIVEDPVAEDMEMVKAEL